MRVEGNKNCEQCSLCETAQSVCLMGEGPIPCETMIIGEAPGYREDNINKPFSGNAGKYLEEEFNHVEILRKDIYITNAVHCRPPDNRTPKVSEIKACDNWIKKEIAEVNPMYILLLGNTALRSALGRGLKITLARGKVVQVGEKLYFPTFHPAAILRDVNKKQIFREDIKRFSQMVKEGELREDEAKNFNPILIDEWKDLEELKKDFSVNSSITLDIETNTLNPWEEGSLVNCIGLGTRKNQWIIPLSHRESPFFRPKDQMMIMFFLDHLLEGKRIYTHSGKFDLLFLRVKYGMKWKVNFDSLMASFLLDENGSHKLKFLASVFYGAPNYDLDKADKIGGASLEVLAEYCARDVYYTRKLAINFRKKLKEDPALYLFYKTLIVPTINMFIDVERRGAWIRKKELGKIRKELQLEADKVEEGLNRLAGEFEREGVNWNSPTQVSEILFELIGLEPIEVTKTGAFSTSESVLKQLSLEHDLPKLLLEYRGLTKLLTGFLRSWEEKLVGNRLHPTFKLHGAVTGRLSCGNPNLQQVPRKSIIRSLFSAPKGWKLVEADYSQIELRIVASLSKDPEMMKVFLTGGDIHTTTAQLVSGEESGEKEWRKKAKAVNFGLIYGMGAKKLRIYAKEKFDVDLSYEEARDFKDKFFTQYSSIRKWHKRQIRVARNNEYVRNLMGRVRHLPEIHSRDFMERSSTERKSINSPVQSLASDLLISGAIELHRKLDPKEFRIIGTIHDALLMEIKTNSINRILPIVKETMEKPEALKILGVDFLVPIEVEISIGNWGAGEKWEGGELSGNGAFNKLSLSSKGLS